MTHYEVTQILWEAMLKVLDDAERNDKVPPEDVRELEEFLKLLNFLLLLISFIIPKLLSNQQNLREYSCLQMAQDMKDFYLEPKKYLKEN